MPRQSRAHAGGHPPSAHTLDGRDWREIIIVTAIACGCLLGLTGCAADEQTQGAGSENTADSATDRETRPPAAEQGRDGAPTPVTLRGSVTDVVDGDTIKVVSRGFETTVRLLGIDTPETRRPGGFVQCFGPAASARTRRLLANGQDVRLVTDVSQDRRDRYGRLLAYVYKPGRSGATGSVNHALVATGYAKVYIYRGNRFRHAGPFEEAEARARRRAIGLWGAPCRGNTTKRDPATIPPPSPSPLAGATSAEARFLRLQPRRRLWQGTAILQAFPTRPAGFEPATVGLEARHRGRPLSRVLIVAPASSGERTRKYVAATTSRLSVVALWGAGPQDVRRRGGVRSMRAR